MCSVAEQFLLAVMDGHSEVCRGLHADGRRRHSGLVRIFAPQAIQCLREQSTTTSSDCASALSQIANLEDQLPTVLAAQFGADLRTSPLSATRSKVVRPPPPRLAHAQLAARRCDAARSPHRRT